MILTIHRASKQIGGSCVELRSDRGARHPLATLVIAADTETVLG